MELCSVGDTDLQSYIRNFVNYSRVKRSSNTKVADTTCILH